MEIGVLFLFILIALFILFGEGTKVGAKFFSWFGNKFFDIDLEQLED